MSSPPRATVLVRFAGMAQPPETTGSDEWLLLSAGPLAVEPVHDWAAAHDCGAVVLFSGTVRDHADGRSGVVALEYEAYEEMVIPAFGAIVAEIRSRFPATRRVAIHHRTGRVPLGESTVVVAASSAHRPVAFDAARFAIDALKASAPIWKKEMWEGGEHWGTRAHDLVPPSAVPGPGEGR